jgi:hypothetical protein
VTVGHGSSRWGCGILLLPTNVGTQHPLYHPLGRLRGADGADAAGQAVSAAAAASWPRLAGGVLLHGAGRGERAAGHTAQGAACGAAGPAP